MKLKQADSALAAASGGGSSPGSSQLAVESAGPASPAEPPLLGESILGAGGAGDARLPRAGDAAACQARASAPLRGNVRVGKQPRRRRAGAGDETGRLASKEAGWRAPGGLSAC